MQSSNFWRITHSLSQRTKFVSDPLKMLILRLTTAPNFRILALIRYYMYKRSVWEMVYMLDIMQVFRFSLIVPHRILMVTFFFKAVPNSLPVILNIYYFKNCKNYMLNVRVGKTSRTSHFHLLLVQTLFDPVYTPK